MENENDQFIPGPNPVAPQSQGHSPGNLFYQFFCEFLIHLIFTILLGIYTHNEKDYGPNCSEQMLKWSFSYFIFYVFVCSNRIIACIIVWTSISSGDSIVSNKTYYFFNAIRVIEVIAGIVLYIGTFIAYTKHEHCLKLGNVIFVILLLHSIVYGIMFLVLFCYSCVLCCALLLGGNARPQN